MAGMEQRWIKKIQKSGSDEAANALVSYYYDEMFAFIYKQTLDRELALDVTQEIFISMLRSIKNYDKKKAHFRTWLYRIASNRLVDYYRSKYYQTTNRMEPIDETWPDQMSVEVVLERKEDYEQVNRLVNRLDPAVQYVIRMKLFGEYTFQEIAASVGDAESTIKTRYYSGIKRIRKEWRD